MTGRDFVEAGLGSSQSCDAPAAASSPEAAFKRLSLDGLREGTTRAVDAQGTPTQCHISPSILVYEDTPEVGRPYDKQ